MPQRRSIQPDREKLRMWYDALNTGATYHVLTKALMWSTRIKLYKARSLDRTAFLFANGADVRYPLDVLTLAVRKNGVGWDIELSRTPQIAGKYDANGKLVPTPEPPEFDITTLWRISEESILALVKAESSRLGYDDLFPKEGRRRK